MAYTTLRRMVCIAAFFMVPMMAFAQTPNDSTYRLVVTVGGGASLYTSPEETATWTNADVSKFGPAATFRVMWHPDHLLSVGLESGWTKLYSYETSEPVNGEVFLSQVPVYMVWSMRFVDAINVFGGYGYSHLNTNLNYAGTVNISTWSMGWLAACSFEHPLTSTLGVAAELKWINAVEANDAALTLQVQLVYTALEW
jgi:hypothetical protein